MTAPGKGGRIYAYLERLYQMMGRAEIADEARSAARSLIVEVATTVPDQELKHDFRQRALKHYRLLST